MTDKEFKKSLLALGKEVKRLRSEKGISTIEMSRRCLMDSGNYVRIEQGKINVTFKTITKICKALDINYQELFKEMEIK